MPPPGYVGRDGNVLVSRILLPGASDLVWSKEAVPQDTVGKERGEMGWEEKGGAWETCPGPRGGCHSVDAEDLL